MRRRSAIGRGMVGLTTIAVAAGWFTADPARAIVIEGEGLVAESNAGWPAIGEWVGFLILLDLSRPDPYDATTVFYLDRPGNGMFVTTRLGGPFAPVTHEIGCNGVGGAAWNDDPSRGDALSAVGTACGDYTTGEPVYAALLELRDDSAQALSALAFPDPVVLADFPDYQRLDVVVEEIVGEQPRAFSVAIVRIPEAGATVAGLAALLALGAVAAGRGSDRGAHRDRPRRAVARIALATVFSVAAVASASGPVVGWGDDALGQATPPAAVDGSEGTALAIAAGYRFSLAISAPAPGSALAGVVTTAALFALAVSFPCRRHGLAPGRRGE